MRTYKVSIRYSNYYFKAVYIYADTRLAAAALAKEQWELTHTTKCIIWAVE